MNKLPAESNYPSKSSETFELLILACDDVINPNNAMSDSGGCSYCMLLSAYKTTDPSGQQLQLFRTIHKIKNKIICPFHSQ